MSPSNGDGAGSPSTPRASPWRSPARASWARAIPTTCSPTRRDGQIKEAEVTRTAPKEAPTHGDIRQGFVYERVPHITLKSIANNAEIDVIWEKWQPTLETQLRGAERGTRQVLAGMGNPARGRCGLAGTGAQRLHARMVAGAHRPPEGDRRLDRRQGRVRVPLRQALRGSRPGARRRPVHGGKPLAASRARRRSGRRAGRHRRGRGGQAPRRPGRRGGDRLRAPDAGAICSTAGVQQAHKEDRITFTALTGWPGHFICAEGRFMEGDDANAAPPSSSARSSAPSPAPTWSPRRARRRDAGFDVLIACAFNYDAHSAEFDKLGRIPVLKARMNPDLHMADELKNTGAGNLFVIFGEPDIDIEDAGDGRAAREDQRRGRVQAADRRSRIRRPRQDRAAGCSTPTTTRKASSSATPTSSAPTTPTRR